MGYAFLVATILLTALAQVLFKWQIDLSGEFPPTAGERFWYLYLLLTKPWVISAYVAAFIASLTWLGTLKYLELSFAYPFISLSIIIVVLCGVLFFGETWTYQKLVGALIATFGLVLMFSHPLR